MVSLMKIALPWNSVYLVGRSTAYTRHYRESLYIDGSEYITINAYEGFNSCDIHDHGCLVRGANFSLKDSKKFVDGVLKEQGWYLL